MYEIEPLDRVQDAVLLKVLSLCKISSGMKYLSHGTYDGVVLIGLRPSPTFDTACVGGQFSDRKGFVWECTAAPKCAFGERNTRKPQGSRSSRYFFVLRCQPHKSFHIFGEPQPHQRLTKV